MIRFIIAVVLGAVILQAWGFVSWMVLGLHDNSFTLISNDSAVVEAVELATAEERAAVDTFNRAYYFPPMPEMSDAAGAEAFARGPVGILFYKHPAGAMMAASVLAIALGLNFISALIAAGLLWTARAALPRYILRLSFVILLGVLIALVADGGYWNWMHFPPDYSIMMAADRVIAWLLAGLVMAALIRQRRADGA